MTNSPWRLLIYIFTIIPSHCTKLLHVCTGVHGHMYIFTIAHLYSILGNPGKLPEIFCKINTMAKPLPSFRHLSSFDKQTQSFRVTSLFPPRNTFFRSFPGVQLASMKNCWYSYNSRGDASSIINWFFFLTYLQPIQGAGNFP